MPIVIALMFVALAVIYYVSPAGEQEWRRVIPGSVSAVIMWWVVSLGFKLYVENFSNYTRPMGCRRLTVLMLWFYLTGIVLLLGGEINAEIEESARARTPL